MTHPRNRSFLRTAAAVVACLAVALGAPASAEETRSLYELRPERLLPRSDSPGVVGRWAVEADAALLEGRPEALRLELPGLGEVEAIRSGYEIQAPATFLWSGRFADGEGLVVATADGGRLAAHVWAPGGVFELAPTAAGTVLEKIDGSRLPACEGGLEPPAELRAKLAQRSLAPSPFAEVSPAGPGEGAPGLSLRDSANQVDTLVLYSQQSVTRAGGVASLETRIRQMVNAANNALANSGVSTRFVLVGMGLYGRDDSGDSEDDLTALTLDGQVGAQRDQAKADLVSLISTNIDVCGLGWVMRRPGADFAPFGYQLTAFRCIVLLTWPHENGHNMGLEHDPPNGPPPGQASYRWSFGHFEVDDFHTVMSYSSDCGTCVVVPHFSNPAIDWNGRPTGIDGQRDNHRTIGLTAGIVANFRRRSGGGGGGGGQLPAAPTNVAVTVEGLTAQVVWEDASGNETGFRIYRGPTGGTLVQVAELAAGSTVFVDPDLEPASSYEYQVGAFNGQGERKSPKVAVETPAALPVTVELAAMPAATTGTAVELTATFTGPVERAEWSLGTDELGRSLSPCGPSTVCAFHFFLEPGVYPIEVTAIGDLGQKAAATGSLTVTGPSATLPVERSLVQSVIFGPRGNTGTFESSCWTHNSGAAPALVEYTYLPRGAGNPDPASRRLTVPAGQTMFHPNIVSTLFGEADSQGSVEVAYYTEAAGGSAGLRTICRSFVSPSDSAGSFGQFVGENREAEWSSEAKVLTGIRQDDGFTATVLAANVDDVGGQVTVELFDADGAAVGTPGVLGLGRRTMRFRPLAQLFPEVTEQPGPYTARFTSDGIRFLASSTLLESESEDQVFVNAAPALEANPLFVPRVTKAASQFDAFLVSQLIARNNSSAPTDLEIELWQRGQSNTAPLVAERTIPGDGVLVVEDVIADLFGLDEGVGALKITWSNAEDRAPRILTYSFNQSDGGLGPRFGMLVDSLPAASAAAVSAVDFGAEQSALFKADFGILNLRPGATRVEVTLRREDNKELAVANLTLKALQHLERNLEGIFPDVSIGTGTNWTVETRVETGGPILTYLANINVTGDIFFVPGAVMP